MFKRRFSLRFGQRLICLQLQKPLLAVALSTIGARLSLAHPGHETLPIPGNTTAHYFLEPQHGIVGGLLFTGAAFAIYFWMRRGSFHDSQIDRQAEKSVQRKTNFDQ